MSLPLFAELGKPCSDLLNTGYPLGQVRLDTGIRTCGNVNIGTSAALKTEDWSMDSASLDCKYNVQPPSLKTTVNESWDLNNKIKLGVTSEDLAGYVPGCKISAVTSLNPDTGKISGKLTPQIKTSYATMELGIEAGDDTTPSLSGSIVGGCGNWLAGVKGNFNLRDVKLDSHTIGVGYCAPSFHANIFCDNLDTFRVSAYQRINDSVEAGVMVNRKPGNGADAPASNLGDESEISKPSGGSTTEYAIGGRFVLNPSTTLKAKVNCESKIGMSLETKLREGAILTLATEIDGKGINGGNHKVGLGLELTGNFCSNC